LSSLQDYYISNKINSLKKKSYKSVCKTPLLMWDLTKSYLEWNLDSEICVHQQLK
jgi:hypothetical protein